METMSGGPALINQRPIKSFHRRPYIEAFEVRALHFQFSRMRLDEPPSLMTIPAELRLLILEFLLIDTKIITREKVKPRKVVLGNWSEASTFSDLINISLTCKTLKVDAQDIFYKNNTFYFKLRCHPSQKPRPEGIIISQTDCLKRGMLLQKLAYQLMSSDAWKKTPPRFSSFHFVNWKVGQLAQKVKEIIAYKNKLSKRVASNPEAHNITVHNIKSVELILKIPDSFQLCPLHHEVHAKNHGAIINPTIVAKPALVHRSVHHARFFSRTNWTNLEDGLEWKCAEELEQKMKELSKQVDVAIGWDVFELKRDTSVPVRDQPAGCGWFRLQFLLSFHKKFDKGEKYEKRRAWLLSLGGSDTKSLL